MSVKSEEHGRALISLMANVDSEGKPYIQELAGLKDAERVNTFLYMAKKWEYHYRKIILKDL